MANKKMKVLTIKFDVTNFTEDEIEELLFAASVQGEGAGGKANIDEDGIVDANVVSTKVEEVELDDPITGSKFGPSRY